MNKENREIATNREDIIKVCSDFYQELYSSQNKDIRKSTNESPENLEPAPFSKEEINKALKKNERQQGDHDDAREITTV